MLLGPFSLSALGSLARVLLLGGDLVYALKPSCIVECAALNMARAVSSVICSGNEDELGYSLQVCVSDVNRMLWRGIRQKDFPYVALHAASLQI